MKINAKPVHSHAMADSARRQLATAALAMLACSPMICSAAEPDPALQGVHAMVEAIVDTKAASQLETRLETGLETRLDTKAEASADAQVATKVEVPAPAQQQLALPESDVPKAAMAAAVADGITTGLALAGGAVEMNPLVPTSPLGLIGLTGAKIFLVNYAKSLPEDEKRVVLKTTTGLWGGAAMNNLMVLLGAPPPIPLFAGAIMGVMAWRRADLAYAEEDRVAALRSARIPIAASHLPVLSMPALLPSAADALALDAAARVAVSLALVQQ